MSTAAQLRPTTASAPTGGPQAADVLVVFGISGDLAKVMTFRSLYRLERRKLLNCPIVGVAADNWTVEDLRQRARDSIEACGETIDEEVFKRFAERLSYISGDFADDALYGRVATVLGDAHSPVFYLEIPPVPVRHGHRGAHRSRRHEEREGRGGEALR
jgi:glucose-6-phosphate 1-dehydrogenase